MFPSSVCVCCCAGWRLFSEHYDIRGECFLHQCVFVVVQDGDYFLNMMSSEEERLHQQAKRAEGLMRSQDLPEEGSVK